MRPWKRGSPNCGGSARLEVLTAPARDGAELDLERLVQIVTDAGVELSGAQFGAFFST